MNVERIIKLQITKKKYLQCWKTQPPPFNQFEEILIARVKKLLPPEFTDLHVTIGSNIEGRIYVGGSFNSCDRSMEIWGEIVWLSKHQIFRGRLGADEIEAPKKAPKDNSTAFSLVRNTTRNLNLYGETILVKPIALIKRFGIPDEADHFKVSGMYLFEGNSGSAFRLHDYEATTLYWDKIKYPNYPSKDEFWKSNKYYEFRVAGNFDCCVFLDWLKTELKSEVKKVLLD